MDCPTDLGIAYRSIDRLLEIVAPHIGLPSGAKEPGTRLDSGILRPDVTRWASDTEACNYYHQLCDVPLRCAGYIHYEISTLAPLPA